MAGLDQAETQLLLLAVILEDLTIASQREEHRPPDHVGEPDEVVHHGRADESDRYVSAWLKCVYLRDRIGQTFEGLITTVVEFGAFVQLTAVGTDGLLHIDNLRDDEYVMEPGGRAWVGRTNKRRLSLGARVHVIVTSVNPIEGLVDLSLVTLDTPGKIGPQKSPHRSVKPRGKGRG